MVLEQINPTIYFVDFISQIMPPLCGYGCRQLFERDVGNESDPSDIEIQNLRMQVEQLSQSLEHMAHTNHCDGFNDGSESMEFVNPFHDQSPARHHQNIKGSFWEDNDSDLNIKLQIQYNGTMRCVTVL